MTNEHIAAPALVFNGVEIHDRNEMLCLTDMWRAQGADPARQPANWLASSEAKHFIAVLNPGNSGVMTKRGKNGGTYAHWQIGLAYAQYLSPEFHMWCNTVVRERMEAKPAGLTPEVLEEIRRTDGISRQMIHKVTEQGKALEEQNRALVVMADQMKALISIVRPSVPGVVIRHGRTAGAILKAAGIANCPRNFAKWFADRLEAAGCRVDGYVDTSVCRARLFDPDKAEQYLKNGGMAAVEKKLDERRGQGVLAFNVVRFPITAPLGKARHMSSRMWVEPVRGDNMSPTMMHMQDFVIARETNRYEGEGVYLLGRGEEGPYLQRACSALSGKREIQLSGDNPHYKPSVVTKEWFHENVVGFVVADIKVRDTRELPALHAVWSPAA